MNFIRWATFEKLAKMLAIPAPDPEQQALRIRSMEREVVLPVKIAYVFFLGYYLFHVINFEDITETRQLADELSQRWGVTMEAIHRFFMIYVVINIPVGFVILNMRRFPLPLIHWMVFTIGLLDGLFLAALTLVTGGFDSLLYWVFPGLIVRNAVNMSLAVSQIVLNVSVAFCYLLAGILSVFVNGTEMLDIRENVAEPLLLRLLMLLLFTICCFGVQVLFEKQKKAEEESREFAVRQEQLQATSRLSAEIAHQVKNPLAIINNAAFALQRSLSHEGNGTANQQVDIIREEVERADHILTELMGYAKISEGRVEKLNVTEELDLAIAEVFPPSGGFAIQIQRHYTNPLPSLLMQRVQLREIFVNILKNSREALEGKGEVHVRAQNGDNYSILVRIEDSGPGIPPEKIEKIFEPYYSTKEKGTGLGLAIVKHNVDIYGGSIRVESSPGKGAAFVLQFPARTLIKLRR